MSCTDRNDVNPAHESAGQDAYDVFCALCGRIRGTWSGDALPAPGPCARCRAKSVRSYWTQDWKNGDEQ